MAWVSIFGNSERDIGEVLADRVIPTGVESYRTASRNLPGFRFVDLFNAIETLCGQEPGVSRIESQNEEDLNALLHGTPQRWTSRKLTQSARVSWAVGPEKETLLPNDHFWVTTSESSQHRIIVRLKFNPFAAVSTLEIASPNLSAGEAFMEAIVSTSIRDSIYRNQTLQISFETATKDEYGDVEKQEQLRVTFNRLALVSEDDLVIEEGVRKVLLRNVVDLHERREVLRSYKVPIRRGVLLYGPPGTGKTYACRYLCGKLPNATRIMVTGSALLQVGAVFQLARLLQPAILFLEDVDLVFMSREVNLYSSVLGELLDHMDGLRPFEDIGFVLTTNSIDRMEAAVRDRPGRISQCIYFGPPNPELRRRYLLHYLRHYKIPEVNLGRLVQDSEGATQAFLKEWVHRAVQIGTERISDSFPDLDLRTRDFEEAIQEMRKFSEGSTARIVGFHE